jgi:hypothetical protein
LLISAQVHGASHIHEDEFEEDASFGDQECKMLLLKLQEIEHRQYLQGKPIHEIVIGANLNVDQKKWKKRFDLFTEQGFSLSRTGVHTNICFQKSAKKELDYFFSKTIRYTAQKKARSQMRAHLCSGIEFRADKNISDHLPIRATITLEP